MGQVLFNKGDSSTLIPAGMHVAAALKQTHPVFLSQQSAERFFHFALTCSLTPTLTLESTDNIITLPEGHHGQFSIQSPVW